MNCPECSGEMELNGTGRAWKHKDPAAAKSKGCKIPFIPKVREKGAVTNGNQEKAGQTSEENGGGSSQGGGRGQTGYREAVKRSNSRRGKAGKRSDRSGAEHVPTRAAASSAAGNSPDQPVRGTAKRGWLSDVTEDIFRK